MNITHEGIIPISRETIKTAMENIRLNIRDLEESLIALRKEYMLLCDEEQWFKEELEDGKLTGRIYWREEDSHGELVEKSTIVRVEGVWRI